MARKRVPVDRRNEPVVDHPTVDEPAVSPDSDHERQSQPADPTCDCVDLDPVDWHEVESDWTDITFLPMSVAAILGVPLGYQRMLRQVGEKSRKKGLTIPDGAMMLVGQGRFRRPVLVEVEGPEGGPGSPGLVRPGGFAYSRLVPAAYGDLKRRFEETEEEAVARYGRRPDSMWTWFITCRQCSAERDFETLFVAHYGDRAGTSS